MWLRAVIKGMAAAVGVAAAASVSPPHAAADAVPVITPNVVGVVPHDPAAYSEGLEFDGPALYEATGEVAKSQLRQVDPETGRVIRTADLPPDYFGEGIAVVGDRIWQLTYQNGVAIEWDKATFEPIREVPMEVGGWGLCFDGSRLISSDGTDRLSFHDPASFAEIGGVTVTRDGAPVNGLNELDCVDGQVWAAAWPDDQFVRIDPATGAVNLAMDVSGLWNSGDRTPRQVVSGIAHIAGQDFLISGKDWPQSYKIRIDPS
ncbi:glutaminyl-peptide cyclotransferase [Mycolicibacterium wolinskyi]|nr:MULTISPECIES: glutaminyl-peptide cyclotransferase [Mycolicibacterium]MCV7290255.1 glutaminyl-peptide cyclotransferase [Mycolicibacterium wolinskyi]MCV7297628.1 glutaminyl-peptide cyclotransferase [Mycolicibacterium goodii]